MALILIISVILAISVSAVCSVMEAALYAIPISYLKNEERQKRKAYRVLGELKENIGNPITAILIFNTLAHTIGASVAGWAAGEVLGSHYLIVFSILFTIAILYLSEILPKMLGVVHCRKVSLYIAWPLYWMTKLVTPIIWLSKKLSLDMNSESHSTSVEDIIGIAELGTEEGALDHLEGSVIANVIGLDDLLVKDVLTPRVVVFRVEENAKIKDLESEIASWNFSRVPLFSESEPDYLKSYVTQRDIYRAILQGKENSPVKEFARELKSIPELMRVDKLLLRMFEDREQICAVADEHGGLAGIITLEDIIEEIVGREIVDEYDKVSDMRTFAKFLHYTKHRKKLK